MKKADQVLVECQKDKLTINGLEILFPAHLNKLVKILGEPSRKERDLLWYAIWDEVGVYCKYGTEGNVGDLMFLISDAHRLKLFPKNLFSGQIKVFNKIVEDTTTLKFAQEKYEINNLIYKGQTEPYCIRISENPDYQEKLPKDKYLIKDLGKEKIEFADFGFKLCVIQELMYKQELLKPRFDISEFVKLYDERKIDLEEEGYAPISEITQYFKDLQIPKKLASKVTRIYQDGGNDIYKQLVRFGDGSEGYWNIKTAKDVKNFPNLKQIVLCYAEEEVLDELHNMGIEARWI